MSSFVGKLEQLTKIKSKSLDGKFRYYCPFCDSIHKKEPDTFGCVVFNHNTLSGFCFRCKTLITHDGLKNLEYIEARLNKKEQEKSSQLLKINWLEPIKSNPTVLEYLRNRGIFDLTMNRFDVMACNDPFDAVVFINKKLENDCTDFLQVRWVNNPNNDRHAFIKSIDKKLCWLHHARNPELIICEGFTSGLSAFQHSEGRLNPVILGGSSLITSQLQELKEFSSNYDKVNIVVCLDGGFFEDTLKVATKIYQGIFNAEILVMPMPFNLDLNDLNTEEFNFNYKNSLQFSPSNIKYIRDKVYRSQKCLS